VKRALIVLAVVFIALVTAIGAFGQLRRAHREARQQAAVQAVIDSHSPLQRDAAQIDGERRIGHLAHFAQVPKTLPPGLVGMEPVENPYPDGVYDVYEYDGVKAVVKFTDSIGDNPCGDQTCVRQGALGSTSADATGLTHVAIWLTGASAVDKTAIQLFWAKTTWVPIGEATWFTHLAVVGEDR
jgi:hypothetical protein